MKHIRYTILLLILALFSRCAEDIPDSVLITFPAITLNGEAVIMIDAGDPYIDEGALAFVGETEVGVTVSDPADPTTPGVYITSYQAENDEGFTANAVRTLVVLDPNPSAIDLSGQFARGAGRPVNTITRLGDRLYMCDNAGGAFGDGDPRNMAFMFYNVNDDAIFIPFQENVSESGISVAGINDGTNLITDQDNFQWSLNASAAYGTFVRFFSRI